MKTDRFSSQTYRANEAITDDLVRDHFTQFNDDIIIERQSSQNPKIDKLLENASKRGTNKGGRPDIIIQYKRDIDFLIVIENKADKRNHESGTHKEYDKYAVDGALFYASYLSKSYNVLAIGVSGTNVETLKSRISYTLKKSRTHFPISEIGC